MKKLTFLLALAAPLAAQAADTGALVRFVTCPIYRDTDSGRKSGCWLADDRESGVRYDVSQSPYKPDWNRAVLVEGRVSGASPDACGATVLEPVRTSILAEPCPRHMLPAEGHPGRKFVLPLRNIAPTFAPHRPPTGPFAERMFPVFFEFDRSFNTYQYGDYLIEQAALWLGAAKPKKVIVTGFAATEPELVSGQTFAERPEVAQERAEVITETMGRLLPGLPIETHWETGAKVVDLPDADSIPGQSQRRVEIRAVF